VQVQITLQTPNTGVKFLQLHGPDLLVVDTRFSLIIYSLEGDGAQRKTRFTVRGQVTCIESDLSLDWFFMGMTDGSIDIWDIDRECLAQLSIENLYGRRTVPGVGKTSRNATPIIAMALHPKDIGYLLVAYSVGAALFSFKENKAVKYFELEIPANAIGGDTDPSVTSRARRPRLTHLAWHPNGTYILTAHEDGCLAFWDAKTEASPVHVRTVDATHVNIPRGTYTHPSDTYTIRDPIVQVAWCSATDPDDTSLVVIGGHLSNLHQKGLTYFDFGPSPTTLVGDYMANYFASPRKQRLLPTSSDPISCLILPSSSPFYNGTHEPLILLSILETGDLSAFSMPDCQPLAVAKTLPPAIAFISPPATRFSIIPVPQQKWLTFIGRHNAHKNRNILLGGAPTRRPLRRMTVRNVMLSAHADGVIRIWDVSHGEVEANESFEVDVAGIIHAFQPETSVDIVAVDMAAMTGELCVGIYSGEVCIWRFGRRNRDEEFVGEMGEMSLEGNKIVQSTRHLHFNVSEGFLPLCMVNPQRGAPVLVKMSEVGFIAIGYDTGYLCVVDLRGPAVICLDDVANFQSDRDKKNRRRGSTQGSEIPTAFEFSIMKLEGNDYSSLVLLTGTSTGRLLSHVLVPGKTGGYAVQFDNSSSFTAEGRVVALLPFRAQDGVSVIANPNALAGLGGGHITEAALVVVQEHGIRILGGVTNKLEKIEVDDRTLLKAEIVGGDGGIAIAAIGSNRRIAAWSIPDLKRINELPLPNNVVAERYRW
jgi:syntaxin-binding protein 5